MIKFIKDMFTGGDTSMKRVIAFLGFLFIAVTMLLNSYQHKDIEPSAELVDAVKDGIKRRRRNISLFVINDSNYIVGLDKKEWKPSLQSALKYYEIKEEYNKCSEIVNLIKSL
jgi:hypothetical protein